MLKKSMFYLVLFSMLLLSASLVMAETDLSDIDLSSLEGATIPSFLEPLFGNENINIHVTLSSGETLIMGVSISEAVVQEISNEALDDASLDVYVSQGVMEKLSQSDDPASVFQNALDNDEIIYKANGIWNKIKFGFAGLFMKFGSSDSSNEDAAIVDEIVEEVEEEVEEEEVVEETTEEDTETEEEATEEGVGSESETDTEEAESDVAEEVEEEAETEDEETEEVETEAEEEEVEEETTEEETEEESESTVTVVEIDVTEFDPSELTISVGDTVQWVNTRDESTIKTAMVLGNRECNYIRSSLLQYGETFEWTFTEPMTCTITDAIITTAVLTITVEP